MSRKIIGVTVGTPTSPAKIAHDIKPDIKEYVDEQGTQFANALKGSNTGNSVVIHDISPIEHEMSVKVSGKNLLPPTLELKEHRGVTFQRLEDGTYHVFGTNDGTGESWAGLKVDLPRGKYMVSGCPSGGRYDKYGLSIRNNTTNELFSEYGTGRLLDLTAQSEITTNITVNMLVKQNQTVDLIFKLMIEEGTTVTDYIPYVDVGSVEVKKCGKNILDVANSKLIATKLKNYFEREKTASGIKATCVGDRSFDERVYTGFRLGSFAELRGATITVSFESFIASFEGAVKGVRVILYDDTHSDYEKQGYVGNTSYYQQVELASNVNELTCTLPTEATKEQFKNVGVTFIAFPEGDFKDGDTTEYTNIQVEIGSNATEYESFKGDATYTPNADGTVGGVTSLYPVTTLMTDTAGAIIDVEYNRDISRAFAELQQAILSLGGNV